jgi:hypothetical protein
MWCYTRQGKICGPVSSAQLKGLLVAEQIHPRELVWRDGGQERLVLPAAVAVLREDETAVALPRSAGAS